MSTITVPGDDEQLAQQAAAAILDALATRVASTGVAHFAVSGGGTPQRTYELLGREQLMAAVELWFVDERCVPPDHPESNYAMVERTLLAGGLIEQARVHRIYGELGPQAGAQSYEDELRRVLGDRPELDAAVLGIGPDGHTASLFPGSETLHEAGLALAVHDSPKPPAERITLSLPVLRSVASSVMIVTGRDKAPAVAAALGVPDDSCPASLLDRDRLAIFADHEAAGAIVPAGD